MFIVKLKGQELGRHVNLFFAMKQVNDKDPNKSIDELLALGWSITTDSAENRSA